MLTNHKHNWLLNREASITEWRIERHNWNETVFSNEKRLSLDGPDKCKDNETNWATVLPKF